MEQIAVFSEMSVAQKRMLAFCLMAWGAKDPEIILKDGQIIASRRVARGDAARGPRNGGEVRLERVQPDGTLTRLCTCHFDGKGAVQALQCVSEAEDRMLTFRPSSAKRTQTFDDMSDEQKKMVELCQETEGGEVHSLDGGRVYKVSMYTGPAEEPRRTSHVVLFLADPPMRLGTLAFNGKDEPLCFEDEVSGERFQANPTDQSPSIQ